MIVCGTNHKHKQDFSKTRSNACFTVSGQKRVYKHIRKEQKESLFSINHEMRLWLQIRFSNMKKTTAFWFFSVFRGAFRSQSNFSIARKIRSLFVCVIDRPRLEITSKGWSVISWKNLSNVSINVTCVARIAITFFSFQ